MSNLVRSAKGRYVPVRIRVTDKDIELGDMGETKSCPIARSLKRIVTKDTTVCVGYRTLTLTRKGKRYSKGLPQWASDFIGSFDATGNENPRRAKLQLPTQVLKRFTEVR